MFSGGSGKEVDPMGTLEGLQEKIRIGKAKLDDPEQTEFIPVTIPTMLALWETDRLSRALIQNKISAKRLIINQINPENKNCKFCTRRHSIQLEVIDKLHRFFGTSEIYEAQLQETEPQGVEALKEFAYKVFGK